MTSLIDTREHYFHVITAKHVFLHNQKGIVFVNDPIRLEDAEQFNLKPLLLYGISVPGTRIDWCIFSSVDQPLSLLGVLQKGWSNAFGLRGYPDTVKINRHLAASCPHLKTALQGLNIKLEVADGTDKRFSASLRNIQKNGRELGWWGRDLPFWDVRQLNEYALVMHGRIKSRLWTQENAAKAQSLEWLQLPFNSLESPPKMHLERAPIDWTPGPWLSAWEVNAPPDQTRYFWRPEKKPEVKNQGCFWLLSGEAEDETVEYLSDEEWGLLCAEKIKMMVDCWPAKPSEIAAIIGIKTQQLLWFIKGKTHLHRAIRQALMLLVGVKDSDDGIDFEVTGPCVLMANSIKKCADVYDELSYGGDLEYSFEILPDKGVPDPSWRYLVFAACGEPLSVFMFQRGSKAAEQMNSDWLINFQGKQTVPKEVYRDVVSTCSKCCANSLLNRELTYQLGERHQAYFESLHLYFH